MTLVDLISTEAAGRRGRLLAVATLVSAANALVLALVNAVAAAPEDAGLRLFALFALAVALFALGARYTYHYTINLIETALHRIRTRIVAKIERTGFQQMERIGTAEIMDRVTENTAVISDSASMVAHLLQSLCILAFGTGDRFTNRNLSTGQRKRLALIVALLEDRRICLFDEWAADQDPEFRKYFYEELIPELKRRGKTVIAVSHDDRYFRCADRVVTMDYGQIRSIERISPEVAAEVGAGPMTSPGVGPAANAEPIN